MIEDMKYIEKKIVIVMVKYKNLVIQGRKWELIFIDLIL